MQQLNEWPNSWFLFGLLEELKKYLKILKNIINKDFLKTHICTFLKFAIPFKKMIQIYLGPHRQFLEFPIWALLGFLFCFDSWTEQWILR